MKRLLTILATTLVLACGEPSTDVDGASPDSAHLADAGAVDAVQLDSSAVDRSQPDATSFDTGAADAATTDATTTDAATTDSASPDAAAEDADSWADASVTPTDAALDDTGSADGVASVDDGGDADTGTDNARPQVVCPAPQVVSLEAGAASVELAFTVEDDHRPGYSDIATTVQVANPSGAILQGADSFTFSRADAAAAAVPLDDPWQSSASTVTVHFDQAGLFIVEIAAGDGELDAELCSVQVMVEDPNLASKLVTGHSFEPAAVDNPDNGYTYNLIGTPQTVESGRRGQGLLLDGIDDAVEAPGLFAQADGPRILSTWIRMPSTAGDQLLFTGTGGAGEFTVGVRDGKLLSYRNAVETTGARAIVSGTWHHVAVSFGADSELDVLLDSWPDIEDRSLSGPMAFPDDLHVGDLAGAGANPLGLQPFAGDLDELRLHDSADPGLVQMKVFSILLNEDRLVEVPSPTCGLSADLPPPPKPNMGIRLNLGYVYATGGYYAPKGYLGNCARDQAMVMFRRIHPRTCGSGLDARVDLQDHNTAFCTKYDLLVHLRAVAEPYAWVNLNYHGHGLNCGEENPKAAEDTRCNGFDGFMFPVTGLVCLGQSCDDFYLRYFMVRDYELAAALPKIGSGIIISCYSGAFTLPGSKYAFLAATGADRWINCGQAQQFVADIEEILSDTDAGLERKYVQDVAGDMDGRLSLLELFGATVESWPASGEPPPAEDPDYTPETVTTLTESSQLPQQCIADLGFAQTIPRCCNGVLAESTIEQIYILTCDPYATGHGVVTRDDICTRCYLENEDGVAWVHYYMGDYSAEGIGFDGTTFDAQLEGGEYRSQLSPVGSPISVCERRPACEANDYSALEAMMNRADESADPYIEIPYLGYGGPALCEPWPVPGDEFTENIIPPGCYFGP